MGRFNWDWSAGGPPDEAYSRVTEPERFRPLHDWTLELLARLDAEFEVEIAEWDGRDAELERSTLARPLVKLTPGGDSRAPIIIAFTTFPGLTIRFGRWYVERFPDCGCDACDEMPDENFDHLRRLVDCVVAGGFREAVYLTPGGDGRREREFWSSEHSSIGSSGVSHPEADAMLGGESSLTIDWMPWHKREG